MALRSIDNRNLLGYPALSLTLAILASLCVTTFGRPAILTKSVSFETHSDQNPAGRQVYPAGTSVDATPAANGQFLVDFGDGPKFLVPGSSLRFESDAPSISGGASMPTGVPHQASTGSPPPEGVDVKTISGQVYKNAHLARVEPDGITYFFAGGAVKVLFTDLPEETRRQYGYDLKKAEAFAAADNAAQEAAWHAANPTPDEILKAITKDYQEHYVARAPESDLDGGLPWSDLDAAKKRSLVEAKDLIALYDENEFSADRVCKGKVGKIRGEITDISRDILGQPYVMLNHSVRCAFPKGDEDQLTSLSNGQAVVIIGQIHGKTLGCVSMYKCSLFR